MKDYFDPYSAHHFGASDEKDLAKVILSAHSDSWRKDAVVSRCIKVYEQHCWEGKKKRLCRLVVKLAGERRRSLI
jgi:hypothetical protein